MKTFFIVFSLLTATGIMQAQPTARIKEFNLEKGIAIQGYDPVAYFLQGKAVKGNAQHQYVYEGITYRFANNNNLEQFKKDPLKYEPQYGGWCAYAMGATGEKVEIDPETFKIVNGKLYLFYHSWTNNTLPKWNDDENRLRTKADKNWLTIFK